MADAEILNALSEGLCSCRICGRPQRRPKALPCLHSFCKTCLNDHINGELERNGSKSFPCPKCRQTTLLPSDGRRGRHGDSFKDDTFVNKLSEVLTAYNDDKSCDICDRRDVTAPAVNWCMDCYDALCDACGKVHLHGATTADHVVISADEMRKLPLESVMKRKRSVLCGKHEGEVLKLFCVDCRGPACVQCAATSHRTCKNCVTVVEAMSEREEDLGELIVQAEALQLNPEGKPRGQALGDSGEVLEETIKRSEERIKSLSADLIKRIEESQSTLLSRLNDSAQKLRSQLNGSKKAPPKDHMTTLKCASERMQALLKYGSDVEILQVYETIKDSIQQIGQEGDSTVEPPEDMMVRVNFAVTDPVKLFNRDFEELGEIQIEDCNSDEGLSSWGVACTSKGEIIVADCRNKRVQKFTGNGDLIDQIQISEEPRDLTRCGEREEVAITINKKVIFFVITGGQMALKKRVRTDKQYDSIEMSKSEDSLLVSCLKDASVDLISLEGEVLKSFNADAEGNPIFVQPRYVCFTREGNYAVTDVTSNTVKCISPEGQLVYAYHPDGAHVLRKPQGLCADKIGNIFIADYANSRIQLITSEGYFQRFVLARESGLSRPVAINMTSSNKLIVVQSDGMVKVFSYE
ncbi:E3 ubiquitin-protein ligase TRIM56-like [Haliotis cracherodii]|uniref:E3 ubiquitin-protein ligase TRIM56-like n=1 Tax=Haliotis cracherodii TaxID=6455 RepID=UPI0039EA2DE1